MDDIRKHMDDVLKLGTLLAADETVLADADAVQNDRMGCALDVPYPGRSSRIDAG